MTDDRFIRLPEVLQRTGLSRVTIWRRIREGHFPASVRLGPNCVAWRESDFLAWMADPASWAKAAA